MQSTRVLYCALILHISESLAGVIDTTRFSDQDPRRIYPQEIMRNLGLKAKKVPRKISPTYRPLRMERLTETPPSPKYRVAVNPAFFDQYHLLEASSKPNIARMPHELSSYSPPNLRFAPIKKGQNAPKESQYLPSAPKKQSQKRISLVPKLLALPNLPPLPKLPKQTYPHELRNVSTSDPFVFHPQPFSFPGYPVVVYLKK